MSTTSTSTKTIEEIKALHQSGALRCSHSSLKTGYVSRRVEGIVREYHGRFGDGFIIDSPCRNSTRYFFRTYYVTSPPMQ